MRELFQAPSGYLPTAYLADTSQQKDFTGATDPSTVTAVSLAVGDTWSASTPLAGGGYGASPYGVYPYGM